MKNTFLIILWWLSFAGQLQAQRPNRSRDSIGVIPWKANITRAPVLTGASAPRIIVPHEQALCFPTEFDLKISTPRKVVEQCMFINTTTGVIGLLPPHENGLVNMLFPELADFSFQVMSLKGNVYHYHNSKGKNNTIDRWVSTGNTETHQFRMTGVDFTAAVDLQRKNMTAAYCNGHLTAMAYRFSGNPDMVWYLYGDRFPEKLHPLKFLGNMGVGYLYTREGVYIITEFRSTAYSCRVTDIQLTNTCLSTLDFKLQEDDYIEKRSLANQNEKAKLDRKAAGISGNCADEQRDLISFKQEQARKQELALQQAKSGNTYQNTNAQRAMLSGMDPLVMVQENILSTKLSICRAQSSAGSRREEKLNCLTNQLSILMTLEAAFKALDLRYANEPGKAFAEKSKLYMQRKPMRCS